MNPLLRRGFAIVNSRAWEQGLRSKRFQTVTHARSFAARAIRRVRARRGSVAARKMIKYLPYVKP